MRTLIGCIVLAVLCALTCHARGNLLVNPEFAGELDSEDFGWSVRRGGGPEKMEVAIDREVTFGDGASIRFTQGRPVYSSIAQRFEPKPRAIYAAGVWVKAEDFVTTSRGVRLFIGDENDRTLTADRLYADEATGDWQQLTCVFNSRQRPRMSVIPMLSDVCGTVWFAEPTLHEVTPERAASLTGRAHGWWWVEPEPGTGVAYFGREAAHVHPGFPSMVWLGNRRSSLQPPEDARMVLELPEGVRLAAPYYGWSLVDESAIEGGARYELTGTAWACPVYLETDREPGTSWIARTWLAWEGGRQQEPQEFEVRCIEMPDAPQPQRLVCGLSGPRAGLYPGEMIPYARRLGFNAVNLWNGAAWAAERGEKLAAEVQRWKDAGFRVSANYSPMNYDWYDEMLAAEEDAQACAIDGTRRAGIPCPSYRGEIWRLEGEKIANMAVHGISWAHLDEEVWNGHGICFCGRCLARWEDWRTEHVPNLADLSPTEFEADPDDYPKHHAAWTRFKCSLVTDMFSGWREMLRERAAAEGLDAKDVWFDSWLSASPELNRMYYNLHDPRALPRGLDHLVPMLYERAPEVRAHTEELVAAAGGENVLVGLTLGEPGNGRGIWAARETRRQLLEAVFAGARGYVLWTYPRSDAATLAAVAGTNATLAQIEDVLLDGERTRRLRARGDVDVTAYEHGDRIVALVRGGEGARLWLSGDGEWTVRVVGEDRAFANLTATEHEFEIERMGNPLVLELTRER